MFKSITRADDLHNTLLVEWKRSINIGDFEKAMIIDFHHYDNIVKSSEDVRYWDRWQSETLSDRKKLTELMTKICPEIAPVDKTSNRFAIVLNNYSGLAHEVQLSRNFSYIKKNITPLEYDVIYLFDPLARVDCIRLASGLYDVEVGNIYNLKSKSYEDAANKLNVLLGQNGYHSVIYPTTYFLSFWMSLFVRHGNQKFIQMKYYPRQTGRIVGWAGGQRNSETYYEIKGDLFSQLPTLELNNFKDAGFKYLNYSKKDVTFGSISRPEKISDQEYNEFVLEILRRLPQINYLYTGRSNALGVLPQYIRDHSQSIGLGWVNPTESIHEFSIYLEPFPWGGGEMTFLALSAGVPYLTLETKENMDFGLLPFLKMISSNCDELLKYSFCNSHDQLQQRLIELAQKPDLREALGRAWRNAILKYEPVNAYAWVDFLLG